MDIAQAGAGRADEAVIPKRPAIQGKTLHLVRLGWAALAVFSLGIFVLAIPYHIIYLSGNLATSMKLALLQHGISVNFYIAYQILLDILIVLGYSITAVIIFLHKSDDWMTVFVSMAMLTFGVTVTSLETTSSPLNSLVTYWSFWQVPVSILRGLGVGSFLLVFYLFPDGCFVPRWTRPLSILWGIWLMGWILIPGSSPESNALSPSMTFVMRILNADTGMIGRLLLGLRVYSLVVVLTIWFSSGIFAQIYRYLRVSTPLKRVQTKWAVLGLTFSVSIYFWSRMVPPFMMIALQHPGFSFLRYEMITLPIATAALLLIPITFSVSMMRFRLWDVDFIIHRTLAYGIVMLLLGAVYLLEVLALQYIFTQWTGNQSVLFVSVTTLVIALLSKPILTWAQGAVDRRFFREKVNFREAFTSFASEVRTVIDLPELLKMLVDRTAELLHINYGAVYLQERPGEFVLGEARNLPWDKDQTWKPDPDHLLRLQEGQVVSRPKDAVFPMLVPLLAPRTAEELEGGSRLLGILALGPLWSELHYGREDQSLLLSLADQAGTATYVARLIQETQVETRRRIEAEQRLLEYHNSPIGRAEALAEQVKQDRVTALPAIYELAQQAGKDADSASLLGTLPRVLQNMNAGPVALLAEGYNYLYSSQVTTDLTPIGLRSLIQSLQIMVETGSQLPAEYGQALTMYRLCLQAYEANSIAQISEIELLGGHDTDSMRETVILLAQDIESPLLNGLRNALHELHPVLETLHAYERVDSSHDKLAYLASAVNQLRHVDHLARTELRSVDRPIIEQIAENWLSIVTNSMSELQTSARIVCRLLTRHTWQGEVVSLALGVHNQGRGTALHLRVTLAPATEYTLLDEFVIVERLAPGEEAEVQLRVRPRLALGIDHFRARFVILYTDPRGPDQVENFADVVQLMATSEDFQFIPNPYVVGTPLNTGSPLFFGREDVVKFIQGNLEASHRNNLVLVGQRRTGKTSLLKQLPARLGDDTLPVYLDGQTLGLDPGMPNFFLNLSTEIAFALEDYGYEIDPPELEDFQGSPAKIFEHDFLEKVRQQIGERHLLIMFDEFEELEPAVQRGDLEPTIFGFLRHLIQHQPNLSVIFCGTHRLEQLAADYWNILFNISLYQHIAFLEREEATRLIQDPVASFGMRYDDLALDKIWRVTAGHPYFLQLLCHSLVNHHNKTQRSYVTIADVNMALDDILASGEAHFVYLWTESSPEERLVLTALSRMIPLTGQASGVQVIDFFDERGITLDRQAVRNALHNLTLRDILQPGHETETRPGVSNSTVENYRWKLGLLGLWVEKYKSLSRVVDEAAPHLE